jgi:hypothetical protein
MSNERIIGLKKEESGNQNKVLYDELFVKDSGYRLVSSSPKVFSAIHPDDFGDNFYISEEELDFYIDGFISAISDNVDDVIDNLVKEEANQINDLESGLDDLDTKLSLYRSFKSLNDKWIISSNYNEGSKTRYFYDNNKFVSGDTKLLYEYFSFVNRCGTSIGSKAVIDFSYLSNLGSVQNGQGPTKSLYESLTGLLTENNFIFHPLPAFVTYSDKDLTPLTDMFRTIDGPLNNLSAEPNFVCMFIGGSSRALDIPTSYCGLGGTNFQYTNDSYDVNDPTTYPEDFRSGGAINAFKVRYGQEAQNHFSRIELDQAEFKETQDSLLVIDALVNPSSGSNPTKIGKGNNIYDVNLTRSYTCTVETLGNMQIQPMMFFKLENVPMFRGTYLITDVSHTIKPHNVITSFKGVRQPIMTVPIVTEALSLLDLSLVEVVENNNNQNTLGSSQTSDLGNDSFASINLVPLESIGDNVKDALIYFIKTVKLPPYKAIGIIAAIMGESGTKLNPKALNSSSGAFGIAQWLGNRLQGLKQLTNFESLSTQLQYLWSELDPNSKNVDTIAKPYISKATSKEETLAAMALFERWEYPVKLFKSNGNSYKNVYPILVAEVINKSTPDKSLRDRIGYLVRVEEVYNSLKSQGLV